MRKTTALALILGITCFLAGARSAAVLGDPPSPDEALDKLLEKIEGEAKQAEPGSRTKDGKSDQGKPAVGQSKKESKDAPRTKDQAALPDSRKADSPTGEEAKAKVAPKDQGLDDLLEKLGKTEDAPTPDRPSGAGRGPRPPMPPGPKPEAGRADDLSGQAQKLDEHLEELLGRKPKKKQQEGQGEGQGQKPEDDQGPLADVIKQMRDVEQRLSKPDTGKETRERQEQIVKKLDSVLEQIRKQGGGSGSMRRMRRMAQGHQPGQQPGQTPGAQAQGTGPSKPEKPVSKSILANGKDEWGHLPADLRTELDNVFKEEMLPTKEDLIRRYYLSVARKSKGRGE